MKYGNIIPSEGDESQPLTGARPVVTNVGMKKKNRTKLLLALMVGLLAGALLMGVLSSVRNSNLGTSKQSDEVAHVMDAQLVDETSAALVGLVCTCSCVGYEPGNNSNVIPCGTIGIPYGKCADTTGGFNSAADCPAGFFWVDDKCVCGINDSNECGAYSKNAYEYYCCTYLGKCKYGWN